ncbi:23S rRNA pseudouridine(2605) synthase RluB [Parachitinimonas caeni]|uniref:Pseudouridine synthase n=1 Tax=Parachitinimonas caeni TaxID=3031301 RepID=A0ABT7E2P1_9NEIS|nr:pseudouridine synthase [Parachitinimonas caeni]MDK2126568.1 pseudouridine synthase [Parachitinimonas caeni]
MSSPRKPTLKLSRPPVTEQKQARQPAPAFAGRGKPMPAGRGGHGDQKPQGNWSGSRGEQSGGWSERREGSSGRGGPRFAGRGEPQGGYADRSERGRDRQPGGYGNERQDDRRPAGGGRFNDERRSGAGRFEESSGAGRDRYQGRDERNQRGGEGRFEGGGRGQNRQPGGQGDRFGGGNRYEDRRSSGGAPYERRHDEGRGFQERQGGERRPAGRFQDGNRSDERFPPRNERGSGYGDRQERGRDGNRSRPAGAWDEAPRGSQGGRRGSADGGGYDSRPPARDARGGAGRYGEERRFSSSESGDGRRQSPRYEGRRDDRAPEQERFGRGRDDQSMRREGAGQPRRSNYTGSEERGPRRNPGQNDMPRGDGFAPPPRFKPLQVAPAKKMPMRGGNQKQVLVQQQLREKRVEARHIDEQRLQKALAYTGLGSRRECEEWIAAGRVSVDGVVSVLGARVSPGNVVRVDGKIVHIKWPDRLPRIVMYHKPEGEIVSRDDPEGRVTVFDRLPRLHSSKWVAIGRLDYNTSGLLVFTTSGELANRMMHPRFEVEREYAVRILGQLTDEQKTEITRGIALEDGPARFERLEDHGGEGHNHWYRVVIREGRNREVRRMFEYFGFTVSRLMRVRFGSMSMPSRLKRGQYYELDETEVLAVLKWAGLGLTGTAN